MQHQALFPALALCAALIFSPVALAQKDNSQDNSKKEKTNKEKANKANKEKAAGDQNNTQNNAQNSAEKAPPHPLVGQINTALTQNNLIEPAGICVWDLYQVLVKNVPDEPAIKELTPKVLESFTLAGMTALSQYRQGLSNIVFTKEYWATSQQYTLRLRQLRPNQKEYKLADLFYQGMIALADKQPATAENLFRQGIKEDDKAEYLYNGLGRALSDQKKDNDSLAAYNKAISLQPAWTFPLVNAALKYLRKGELAQAQRLALNAINSSIADIDAHAINGSVNASLGNYEEALREYELVVKQRPNSLSDHITYGRLLLEVGNYPAAEQVLLRAVQINPLDARAQLYLSMATKRRAAATFELALDRVKESSVQKADDHQLQLALADANSELKNNAEMIEALKAALKVEPWHVNLHLRLASALIESDRIPEAIDEYRAVLKINPNIKEAHNALGIALKRTGEKKEALAEYRKALTLDPTFLVARYNLARLLQENGDNEAALVEYKAILSADPTNQLVLAALKELEAKVAPKSQPPAEEKSAN